MNFSCRRDMVLCSTLLWFSLILVSVEGKKGSELIIDFSSACELSANTFLELFRLNRIFRHRFYSRIMNVVNYLFKVFLVI